MQKFIIYGGRKLKGTINVKGAKNNALKVFAASLLTDKTVGISNVPEVEDIKRTAEIMAGLGTEINHSENGEYKLRTKRITNSAINPEIAKKLRASIVLTAPLLARYGSVEFPHPGGCIIGERPIDMFLEGYKALGAEIKCDDKKEIYRLTARKLTGSKFVFRTSSVTATESLMIAATLAKGTTILKNCACEPEVKALADFLNSCGAKITGAGTHEILIKGVSNIKGGKFVVIPDRIEAGSFAILAAATGSGLTIQNCEPEHLDSLLHTLKESGVKFSVGKHMVKIISSKPISINIKTREYPGFPTDLQAPFCVLLTQSSGHGLVHETIFEGRLAWTEDLKRMGANIHTYDPHRVGIKGPTELRGREIESPDLRAGMAYLIAALCANGQSVINNIYQIDRGYEKIEERLRKIGAKIRRI